MYQDDLELNTAPILDFGVLEKATNEGEFVHASFELMKEAMQLVAVASSLRAESHPLPRNHAIIAGHFARISKLYRSLVRQISDGHGGDQQLSITREFMNSVSTVMYLLEDSGDGSRYDAYVFDSLIAEREFLKNIREQVTERKGERLPIEDRLERSIASTMAAAGVTEQDIPSRKKNGWPSNEVRVSMISPTAYSAYRTGSSAVHGTFTDLEKHHLEQIDGGFEVYLEAAQFRPQPLIAMILLGVRILPAYITIYFPGIEDPLLARVTKLIEDTRHVDATHEAWLNRTTPESTTPAPDQEAQ